MEDLSKKILTGRYDPLPESTSPELQRLVRRLLTLEPKARPDIIELLSMQVVQEHLNLLPSVPKSSRPTAIKPQEEFMDLRNTIHTPRRMNDMKHLLPAETRYNDTESATDSTRRKDKARRTKSHRLEEPRGGFLPKIHPSLKREDGFHGYDERQSRSEKGGVQRGGRGVGDS